jgi:hypothetical protein
MDDVYRVMEIAVGPEDKRVARTLFEGGPEDAKRFYNELREEGDESAGAYLVISASGVPLYACS